MTTNRHKPYPSPSPAVLTGDLDFERLLARLLYCVQDLYGQAEGVAERLCQEIQMASQEQVHIRLCQDNLVHDPPTLLPETPYFPIQIGTRRYGVLTIAPVAPQPMDATYPFARLQLLAHTCAIVFSCLECAAYFHIHYQRLSHQLVSFTDRECEVLTLMCRGYDEKAIASALHITPATVRTYRGRIYKQFDVHNRHDAIIAAMAMGLYSPIEHLSPQVRMVSRS